jgi:hypothetical protein
LAKGARPKSQVSDVLLIAAETIAMTGVAVVGVLA